MINLFILIFKFIPDIAIHLVLFLGITGIIVTSLLDDSMVGNFISSKRDIIKYISIFLVVFGVYLEGGLAVTNDYIAKEKAWTEKVAMAELQASEANSKIEYIFQDRVQKVKEVQVVIQEKIRDISVNIDKDCKINTDIIEILNQAAKGVVE